MLFSAYYKYIIIRNREYLFLYNSNHRFYENFQNVKKGALSGLLFESKLTIYELVNIINQMTGKCKGHASICIHQREAPKSKASLWRAMW